MVKNLPDKQETQVRSLGQEDPLEKEMTTHPNILAWRILWIEEPGRLQSTGSQNSQTQLRETKTIGGKTRYRGRGCVFSLESIEEGRKKFSQMSVLKNEQEFSRVGEEIKAGNTEMACLGKKRGFHRS